MSELLRVALVAEGPTDGVVIQAALQSKLADRPFVMTQIFPEGSISFGEFGAGWAGVYRWCHQSAKRGQGRLSRDEILFQNFDLLIIHLDADVAGERYSAGSIEPLPTDGFLPCEEDCPPPADTTKALRAVLLSWCGEMMKPQRLVICMPSKSTDAWVVAALFPQDSAVRKGIECYPNPNVRLGQQPKSKRVRKTKGDYQRRQQDIEKGWPEIARTLSEAACFEGDLLDAVG